MPLLGGNGQIVQPPLGATMGPESPALLRPKKTSENVAGKANLEIFWILGLVLWVCEVSTDFVSIKGS